MVRTWTPSIDWPRTRTISLNAQSVSAGETAARHAAENKTFASWNTRSVISVSVARAAGELVIRVIDQGPGIPASERLHVFEPFAQGSTHESRTTAGAGIGLAVVADVVTAHSGRVWIEDGPGDRGTCVSITLPALAGARAPDIGVITDESPDAEEALSER